MAARQTGKWTRFQTVQLRSAPRRFQSLRPRVLPLKFAEVMVRRLKCLWRNLPVLFPEMMALLALSEVVDLYDGWVRERERDIQSLPEEHQSAASQHLDECRRCIRRMRSGLEYLKEDETANKAFRLANHAVLLQQICTQGEVRKASYDDLKHRFNFSEDYRDPSGLEIPSGRGSWRAFQVAFLLMAAHSAADGNALDRSTVELIWFPTGGGKTEAYLGLAAFSIFMRRIAAPEDTGVQVLMRYTLRLLTAQQFQRASGLVCAMEYLRRKCPEELGREWFSIGIWLGSATTPNHAKDAIGDLNALKRDPKYAENKFILTNCPWCRAQIGPIEYQGKKPKAAPDVLGYEKQGNTVVFKCSDKRHCEYRAGLPVYVIDQDIYDSRPDLVIGTVDKFAMLAWRPEARALFGVNKTGEQEFSPPGLIIQDGASPHFRPARIYGWALRSINRRVVYRPSKCENCTTKNREFYCHNSAVCRSDKGTVRKG